MLVTHAPSGDVRDTALATPAKGPAQTAAARPVIGNSGFGGTLTSGSLAYAVGGARKNLVLWKEKEVTRAQWEMDDATAVTTALATIETALGTDEAAITIKADGTLDS